MSSPFPTPGRANIGRRDFLRWSGAGALAAAGFGLAGCGGDSVGPGGGAAGSLQFAYWGSAFEQQAIAQMLEKFSQTRGIDVTPVYIPVIDYGTKISTMVASNTMPDVAYLGATQLYQLAAQDRMVDLAPYADRFPQLRGRLPSSYFWYEDKLIGSQLAESVHLLWTNNASFAEAGVALPPTSAEQAWTWDTFVDTAIALTADNEGRRPTDTGFDPGSVRQYGTIAGLGGGFYYAMLRSRGGDLFDETGTRCLLDSDAVIATTQEFLDLVFTHRAAPTAAQLGQNAPTTTVQLQTRRIAMVVDGDWILLDLGQSDLEYGGSVLPSHGTPITVSGGAAGGVFRTDRDVEQALDLYTFYNDPQNVDLFRDGLWMPLEQRYYTDQADIDSWASGEIYPSDFRTAAIDTLLNHSVTFWPQNLQNSSEIEQAIQPAWEALAQGDQDVRTVLRDTREKVDSLVMGRWPTREL